MPQPKKILDYKHCDSHLASTLFLSLACADETNGCVVSYPMERTANSLWRTEAVGTTTCKELKSANYHLCKLGSSSTPSGVWRWLHPLPTPWWQPVNIPRARGPSQVVAAFLTHRNLWSNKRCVKPLTFGVIHYATVSNECNKRLLQWSCHWFIPSTQEWEQKSPIPHSNVRLLMPMTPAYQ